MKRKPTKKPAGATKSVAATAAVPSMTVQCQCGHRHGFWHFVKKLIVILIIFALGFAACKFMCGRHMKRMHFSFDANGCLDMSKIKCPMKAAKLMAADLNGDGCITREELRAWRESKREGFMQRMKSHDADNEECEEE